MNGEVFEGYAQMVPPTARTYEEMDYGILFLVREQVMYGFNRELEAEIEYTKWLALAGIVGCLSLAFIIIVIIVLFFSKAITKPIDALTNFTKKLKKAENKKEKDDVMNSAT